MKCAWNWDPEPCPLDARNPYAALCAEHLKRLIELWKYRIPQDKEKES